MKYLLRAALFMREIVTTLFLILTLSSFSQTIKVQGTVFDKKYNEPLIGVTVSVSNSDIEVYTDIDGRYQIDANVGDTLIFRYLPQQYKVRKEIIVREDCSVELVERIIERDPVPLGTPKHFHLLSRIHVKGIITDSQTGKPIENVKVSRKRYEGEFLLIQDDNGQYVKTDSGFIDVFTDKDGYFFTKCFPDDYLDFSHPEYEPQHIQIEESSWSVVLEKINNGKNY